MISHTLTMDERIPLITAIFTDHIQVQMVANLSGDDAQSFINVIDEVSSHVLTFMFKERLVDFNSNLHTPSPRH